MNLLKNILVAAIMIVSLLLAPYLYYYTFGIAALFEAMTYLMMLGLLNVVVIVLLAAKQHRHHAQQIVGISFGAMFTFSALCFSNYIAQIDWVFREKERNKIIAMLKSGEINPKDKVYHLKAWNFPPISNGGNDIIIERNEQQQLTVTFFIDRGFLDFYSAFVYTEDPAKLEKFYSLNHPNDYRINKYWLRATSLD